MGRGQLVGLAQQVALALLAGGVLLLRLGQSGGGLLLALEQGLLALGKGGLDLPHLGLALVQVGAGAVQVQLLLLQHLLDLDGAMLAVLELRLAGVHRPHGAAVLDGGGGRQLLLERRDRLLELGQLPLLGSAVLGRDGFGGSLLARLELGGHLLQGGLAGGEGALALLEIGAGVRGAVGDALADRDRGLALGQLLLATGQPRLALGEHDLGLLLQGGLLAADPVLGVLERLDALLHRAPQTACAGLGFVALGLDLGAVGIRVAHECLPSYPSEEQLWTSDPYRWYRTPEGPP